MPRVSLPAAPASAQDTKVAIGARNVFDKEPPYAAGFGGNSTGYPGFLYSSEGRFVYLSVTRKF